MPEEKFCVLVSGKFSRNSDGILFEPIQSLNQTHVFLNATCVISVTIFVPEFDVYTAEPVRLMCANVIFI